MRIIDVVVVGAVNVDLIARVDRRPGAGETVLGTSLVRRSGGKAANQAAAAARAGSSAALVALVGADAEGLAQIAKLKAAGVNTTRVVAVDGANTGTAIVMVTPDAENTIVVLLGANDIMTSQHVTDAFSALPPAKVVVAQTEVSVDAVDRAAVCCETIRARFVCNPAPVTALARKTLSLADPLVMNEHEAADLSGHLSDDGPEVLAAAVLEATGAASVVVTLGSAGAVLATSSGTEHISAVPAVAVDTTGAGDAFVGTLASILASGGDLRSAVAAAIAAGAEAVSWVGARPPERSALPAQQWNHS